MARKLAELKQEDNVHLAYMECLTSCILTYLKSTGRDYRKVLLNYWNINYEYRTLLSSKNAAHIPLRYLYGLDLSFRKDKLETLRTTVQAGQSVICLCKASKLGYFPRKFLSMESSGFWHAILVQGWEEDKGMFLVADPVVGAVVEIHPDEIKAASAARTDREEMHFFVLQEPESPFAEPDMQEALRICAERNLFAYHTPDDRFAEQERQDGGADKWDKVRQWLQKRSRGVKAWEMFASDANLSLQWTAAERTRWVKQNAVTMLAIKQLRAEIWNVYQAFLPMDEQHIREGQSLLNRVTGAWNACNLYLMKYEHAGEQGDTMVQALIHHADNVKDAEIRLLKWLHSAVARGGRYAQPII
ncbi:hypothetical protein ACFFSY_18145 [Paenibacillus aurantiacus]|uniref:Butirosin biosynthesis protein H N-terminal domain-containing protein n=1 Tax=Paenibacillus aurantiacus TaxID=1936118 RepID=A0ABV5KRJ3_9BACL